MIKNNKNVVCLFKIKIVNGIEEHILISERTDILKTFEDIENICKPTHKEFDYKSRMDLIQTNQTYNLSNNFLIKIKQHESN